MEFIGDMISHFLTITSKHDGTSDAKLLELGNGLSTVGLDLVVDDDMACIFTIDGYMNDSAGIGMMSMSALRAVVPFCTYVIHHLRVANADHLIPYPGADAMTCFLLNITDYAAIGSLIREGVTQGCANGMGREVFDMGSKM